MSFQVAKNIHNHCLQLISIFLTLYSSLSFATVKKQKHKLCLHIQRPHHHKYMMTILARGSKVIIHYPTSLSPAFADIFDEETWYQFFFVFTCCTIVCVFILSRYQTLTFWHLISRYIELRSNDPLDREHRGVRKANPRSARQPLGKEEIKED